MDLDLWMNEDLKQRWITALRSGEYEQATGTLKNITEDGVGYCCLGVLAEISGRGNWQEYQCDDDGNWQECEYDNDNGYTPNATYEMDLHETHYSMSETLCDAVLDEFGITSDAAGLLMALNDGDMPYRHHTFKEIADIIESDIYTEDDEDDDK